MLPMRLSIFNSRFGPGLVFVGTLLLLVASWESVVRAHYNSPLREIDQRVGVTDREHPFASETDYDREWIVFGNCLVLNGVSPGRMLRVWRENAPTKRLPRVLNVSKHEFSPQAYLEYLRRVERYPEIIIMNISSWINSDSFLLDAGRLEADDILGLDVHPARQPIENSFVSIKTPDSNNKFQDHIEDRLVESVGSVLRMSQKKYHLFDVSMFSYVAATTWDWERSLYQLGLQSWFRLMGENADRFGSLSFSVSYNKDWERGSGIMAEKQIRGVQHGHFLTPTYWRSLESMIGQFTLRGTRFIILRMPEHPAIYALNESKYNLNSNARSLTRSNSSVEFIDINESAERSRIRLYDAVHPDHEGSIVLSDYLANWFLRHHADWIYDR